MKTCTLKADDNFHEIYEGLRRTSRLTQDIEKADNPDGRGNGQIIQNRTQKSKIGLGKMEALNGNKKL
jgi:hypothetical protein